MISKMRNCSTSGRHCAIAEGRKNGFDLPHDRPTCTPLLAGEPEKSIQ